jgi:hypothetical protein
MAMQFFWAIAAAPRIPIRNGSVVVVIIDA